MIRSMIDHRNMKAFISILLFALSLTATAQTTSINKSPLLKVASRLLVGQAVDD